ncbi:hypothetical protein QN386_22310 [Pseudomonas sp. CCI3.2]|uniref:hypothetical protein n=1 Tax=unclassified Pseudomonas TaxID=196821 RepID=UPI002B23D4E1|nr:MULTISPECIES: hypothetical protein [unclassified Pseudomonas]MEB0078031.1 hypothetical protein [Pseudomonas sp. MH10out]MEB0104038.1 hypothetical protein [Pseudomonas sp. CCI3.2]MEB0133545.1 hypothetical protein [Pseudomonas sp. CCI2.4]
MNRTSDFRRIHIGTRLAHNPYCSECGLIRATGSHAKCSRIRQAKHAQGSKA